jgi:RNA polymerase sigma-70 factor (ECF subfamily)
MIFKKATSKGGLFRDARPASTPHANSCAHGMDGRSRNRTGVRCIQRIVQEKPTTPPADVVAADDESPDDRVLAARVRSGQHGAFRQLMQRFDRHLFRIARGVIHDDTEAEDVVQEAYARAYHKLDTFRGDAPLRTWLTSILLNEARSRLRKRRSMVGLEQMDESSLDPYWATQSSTRFGSEDPAALAAHAEIRRLIERAVDALPDAFRTVYVLREIEECSVEETASRLALKPETVKTRLHRARRLLRTSLHETLATSLTGTFPFMGRRCADMTTVLMAWLAVEATCCSDGR